MSQNRTKPKEEIEVKPKVNYHKMGSPQECHECILSNNVIDLNKDEYIRREWKGKLVFFHGICHKAWKKKRVQTKELDTRID